MLGKKTTKKCIKPKNPKKLKILKTTKKMINDDEAQRKSTTTLQCVTDLAKNVKRKQSLGRFVCPNSPFTAMYFLHVNFYTVQTACLHYN